MNAYTNDYIEAYFYNEPKKGNTACGDTFFAHSEEAYFICAIADGLGSGVEAKKSAEVIPNILKLHHAETIDKLLSRCNNAMEYKRGAAVTIVKVHYANRTIEVGGVGNIRFYMLHDETKMIYARPVMGYLSGRSQQFQIETYPYSCGDFFLLHSDGVPLKNPRQFLQDSLCACGVYRRILPDITLTDDATFIIGSLLQ